MSQEIEQAAALLLEARRSGQPLELPDWQPADETEAYAIQARVAAALGPVAGWKTGAPAPGAPAIAAPLPAPRVWRGPVKLPAGDFRQRGIELEVAFFLGRDLPPRDHDYSAAEVLAVVSSAHAAIEIVESRFADPAAAPPLWKLADHQSNGGFVTGAGVGRWEHLDLANLAVQLLVNDNEVLARNGGNPVGDPRGLLTFLANHCRQRQGLKAGQWVTTGSYIGIVPVAADAHVTGVLAGIGEVSLQFE